jgi:hypothetical protein
MIETRLVDEAHDASIPANAVECKCNMRLVDNLAFSN